MKQNNVLRLVETQLKIVLKQDGHAKATKDFGVGVVVQGRIKVLHLGLHSIPLRKIAAHVENF